MIPIGLVGHFMAGPFIPIPFPRYLLLRDKESPSFSDLVHLPLTVRSGSERDLTLGHCINNLYQSSRRGYSRTRTCDH